MRSLLDERSRGEIIGRIRALAPEAQPLFGSLRPHGAICHVIDGFRLTFGEHRVPKLKSAFGNPLGKWLIIYSPIPWPKNRIKAPPGFFETAPGPSFDADRERLVEYVERFAKHDEQQWGESPILGPLTSRDWATLSYRHLDHHLRQFGV